jgi:hypothetical protein
LIRSQALYPIELRAPAPSHPQPGPLPGSGLPCPRQDSNLYAVSGTGPSNQPVYQFQHVGLLPANDRTARRRRAMLGEGLEPSRGFPHRILNPARLPIPPPELQNSWSGAEGNRTPDLLNAIQALSQLSYGPEPQPTTLIFKKPCSCSSGADGTRTRGLRCDRPAL